MLFMKGIFKSVKLNSMSFYSSFFFNSKDISSPIKLECQNRKKLSEDFISQKNKTHLLLKNCEIIPKNFFNRTLNNFFFRDHEPSYNFRIVSIINRWYIKKNYYLSSTYQKKQKYATQKMPACYISKEPLIRKIKFLPKESRINSTLFKFGKINKFFLTKLLKIRSGAFFRWDSQNWEQKFKHDLFEDGKITLKTLKNPEEANFMDLFVEMKRKSNKKLEPELTLSDDSLSGSISFSDFNFFGLGLIFKNKLSKNNRDDETFRIDLLHHLKEYGNFTFIHEKIEKKKICYGLKLSKKFDCLLDLNLFAKLKFFKKRTFSLKEKKLALSLGCNKISMGDGNWLTQELKFFSNKKDYPQPKVCLGFLYEMKKRLFHPFEDIVGLKFKFSKFSICDLSQLEQVSGSFDSILKGKNLTYPEKFFENLKKYISIESKSSLGNLNSSSIFLKTNFNSIYQNMAIKKFGFGITIKNFLSFDIGFFGEGTKKISFCFK
mmetsp:Transcript_53593/g.107398  ORF Transcript_53593/g.107398 Transcript_53593/m.107398 type:complete len:490 (-) Transcript_53593:1828-3297(-)